MKVRKSMQTLDLSAPEVIRLVGMTAKELKAQSRPSSRASPVQKSKLLLTFSSCLTIVIDKIPILSLATRTSWSNQKVLA